MCGRKMFFGLVVGVVLIGLSLSQAQPPQGPPRPQGPPGPPGERMRARFDPNQQMQRDPNQMQRMMNERQLGRVREALQPSEAEWKTLEPKITKVLTLSRQTGGMGMGRRAGGQGPDFRPDQSQIGKSTEELQTVLQNKDAKQDEIKVKLTALRDAREKTKQELAKAQQELRGGLNLRQEAQLVLLGLLD